MKAERMKVGMRVVAVQGHSTYIGNIQLVMASGMVAVRTADGNIMDFHRRQLVPLVKRKRREWTGSWTQMQTMGGGCRWVFDPGVYERPGFGTVTLIEKRKPKGETTK